VALAIGIGLGAASGANAQMAGAAVAQDPSPKTAKLITAMEARIKQLETNVDVLLQRIKKVEEASDPPEIDSGKGGSGAGASGKGSSNDGAAGASGKGQDGSASASVGGKSSRVMTLRAPFVVVDGSGKPIFRVQDTLSKGSAGTADRGVYIFGDTGVANFALTTVNEGGKITIQENGAKHSVVVGSIPNTSGMKVSEGDKIRAFIGVGVDGNPLVLANNSQGNTVAAIKAEGQKGVVGVYHNNTPVAYLTESTTPGGGNVSATNPGGQNVFSAGYDGSQGGACVDRKGKRYCLGVGLPGQ
jgi:hypothetical protein